MGSFNERSRPISKAGDRTDESLSSTSDHPQHQNSEVSTFEIDPSLVSVQDNVYKNSLIVPDHGNEQPQTTRYGLDREPDLDVKKYNTPNTLVTNAVDTSRSNDTQSDEKVLQQAQDINDVQPPIDSNLIDFYNQFEKITISPKAQAGPPPTSALVVLSDTSYKHVFSRTWTTETYKASIVERPHRLLAASVGVGAAISLAHQTNKGTQLPCVDKRQAGDDGTFFLVSDPDSDLWVMSSNRLANLCDCPHVTKVHGKEWIRQLYEISQGIDEKLQNQEIEVPKEWPYNDMYMGRGTMNALEGSIGAIELAIDKLYLPHFPSKQDRHTTSRASYCPVPTKNDVLHDRVFVACRPPGHHCRQQDPSGFCLLNNAHIAVQYAAQNYGITHAVILDFDLHHGDGTQDICWQLAGFDDKTEGPYEQQQVDDSPRIGYFSLHDINSFPTEAGYASASKIRDASVCVDAHGMCIWNIHLEKFTSEQEFGKLYDSKYIKLIEKASEFLERSRHDYFAQERSDSTQKSAGLSNDATQQSTKVFKPFIVISAGFDASQNETESMRRHGVYVPTSFYQQFTQDVINKLSLRHKWSMEVGEYENLKGQERYGRHEAAKIISVMEGGYSDGAVSTGVFSHLSGMLDLPMQSDDKEKIHEATFTDSRHIGISSEWLFNPLTRYHFEQACKPRWIPKSAGTIPSFKRRKGKQLSEREQKIIAAEGWALDRDVSANTAYLEWLQVGLTVGRQLWPETIQNVKSIGELEKVLGV